MRTRAHAAAVWTLLLGNVIAEENLRLMLRPTPRMVAQTLMILAAVAVYMIGLAVIFRWVGQGVPAER